MIIKPGTVYYLPTPTGVRSSRRIEVVRQIDKFDMECEYLSPCEQEGERLTLSKTFLTCQCWKAYAEE